jgi:NADH:ubiquinone oxidoreductase subunit F (NADH-binding)
MTPLPTDTALPRLLRCVGERPMTELGAHIDVHGPMPDLRRFAPTQIVEEIEAAGLRGHGGASFPTAIKMRAVASRRKPRVLVANATEGEPASRKDRVLLRDVPHLVLDGAAVAARAVGAGEAILAVSEADQRGIHSLELALAQRRELGLRDEPRFRLSETPARYLSGQESALVNLLNGGPGKPAFGPRPFERGVRQRPTLVQNVETLAHIALIVRHGPAWFRQLGTARDPGSTLVTLSGAVAAPGVYEIDHGMPLAELLKGAGVSNELTAVLIGGYFGTWVPAASVPELALASEYLAPREAALGAGVIVALGSSACAVAETARIADYFAAESAGQCGPCVHGLAAIADTVQQLATGTAERGGGDNLTRWAGELRGRGACQHPDGAVRFIASALRVFAADFADHARNGPCERCARSSVLPAPVMAA